MAVNHTRIFFRNVSHQVHSFRKKFVIAVKFVIAGDELDVREETLGLHNTLSVPSNTLSSSAM